MKHTVTVAISLLFAALILAALPTDAEASIYDDTLRLHVLAASDSEEDQSIKLRIRDRILTHYSASLGEAKTLTEAECAARALLPDIERDVNRWLAEYGVDYTACVTLSEETYDTRVYENFTLPRGSYVSLRVLLDKGEGQNWWCVMYPPMCLDLALGEEKAPSYDGYTEEEWRLIDGDGRTVKFKLLEVLSDLFG